MDLKALNRIKIVQSSFAPYTSQICQIKLQNNKTPPTIDPDPSILLLTLSPDYLPF